MGFNESASGQDKTDGRLTIVSDSLDTIGLRNGTNWELLHFLSDAVQAGHRVIITSTDIGSAKDCFDAYSYLSEGMDGGFILDLKAFEYYGKQHLSANAEVEGIKADYVFDDEIPRYIPYEKHIKVDRDGATSPLTLDQLRSNLSIQKTQLMEASPPEPI